MAALNYGKFVSDQGCFPSQIDTMVISSLEILWENEAQALKAQ